MCLLHSLELDHQFPSVFQVDAVIPDPDWASRRRSKLQMPFHDTRVQFDPLFPPLEISPDAKKDVRRQSAIPFRRPADSPPLNPPQREKLDGSPPVGGS